MIISKLRKKTPESAVIPFNLERWFGNGLEDIEGAEGIVWVKEALG